MALPSFRFERFVLDPADRRLSRDDTPVEVNGRYFDALALLVSEQGRLVSKDRFLDEVWRGVPVTDEALTQCIKSLRKQLGDDAARPRFIETVPKHGYRFIAPVVAAGERPRAKAASSDGWRRVLQLGGAGTIGGGLAGLIGGLIYGFAGASQPLQPGIGAMSVLLVLVSITMVVALIGGAGVALGIAAADFASNKRWLWSIIGGAAGGLIVGAFVKLIGLDALSLLFGRAPVDITGAGEGALLGATVGLSAWLASNLGNRPYLRWSLAAGAITGGAAGAAIVLLGGRLMAGSLDLLAREFPDSRLRLDQLGSLFGESGLGPVTLVATGALEGALFGACVVGAMTIARKGLSERG